MFEYVALFMLYFTILFESVVVTERYLRDTLHVISALAEYNSINAAPPSDAAKFALRLLEVFFTTEQLAVSNCTKA